MGNTVSRGTLDVIFILFPFVLSAGLIISIVVCWWKCKLFFDRRRPEGKSHNHNRMEYPDEPDFGHLINIQEYAENQVGTTIVYDDAPGSICPHPYVYFSDGRITRIVPLIPSPTYSSQHPDHSHSSCPSALLCNNLPRPKNNNMTSDYNGHCYHQNGHNLNNYQYHQNGQVQLLLHPNHSRIENPGNNLRQMTKDPENTDPDLDHDVHCTSVSVTNVTTSTSLTPESREHNIAAIGGSVPPPIDSMSPETERPDEVVDIDMDCDHENNNQSGSENFSMNLNNDLPTEGGDEESMLQERVTAIE